MPHPEHAVEDLTGAGTDGLAVLHLARGGRPRRESAASLFRRVAIAEAVTWALLLTGMFLKYVTDTTELGVRIFGMAHGVVFIAYCLTTVVVAVDQRWSRGRLLAGLAASVPPFVTIAFDRYAERRGMLATSWRLVTERSVGPGRAGGRLAAASPRPRCGRRRTRRRRPHRRGAVGRPSDQLTGPVSACPPRARAGCRRPPRRSR